MSFLKNLAQKYRNWLFPSAITLPYEVKMLLLKLYPSIDWNKVIFYDGIPWFSPYSITLPGFFDRDQIHIYLKRYRHLELRSLSVIVHEAYHVQQYYDLNHQGFGFYRNFMPHYLGLWLQHGYRKHPMELPAYRTEALFEQQYCKHIRSGLELQDMPWSKPFPIYHTDINKQRNWILYFLGFVLTALITPMLPLSYVVLGLLDLILGVPIRKLL